MIIYGVLQGKGQLNILRNAKPIEEFLSNPNVADSLKQKLVLIQEIRDYAIDSLGLNDSENYKTLYDQKGKPILWVVSASPKYQMEEYLWNYPILGELGYKGFFEYKLAIEEEIELKKLDLDTDIDEVNAWSTLGWFKDPILSNMLNKNEGEVANLIIHELTHGTLYVKGNADFSENLATFVGDNGAYEFLKYKYGLNSFQYQQYLNKERDTNRFGNHILKYLSKLDSLYNSFNNLTPDSIKHQLKYQFISECFNSLDSSLYSNPTKIQLVKEKYLNNPPNNCYFLSFKMYREKQSELDSIYKIDYKSCFKPFLEYLKTEYN